MLFINNIPVSAAPWHIQDPTMGSVVDNEGKIVAVVPYKYSTFTADSAHRIGAIPNAYTRFTADNGHRISGVPIDTSYYVNPDMTDHEDDRANLKLIACAPELLAALREAAYHLDVAGIPLNDAYYDLINRASSGVPVLSPRNKPVDK